MDKITLIHYSPDNGIAVTSRNGKAFRCDPPYDESNLSQIDWEVKNKKKSVDFDTQAGLKMFLQYKNSLHVAVNVRPFIKKESLRPETISDLVELKAMLSSIIDNDLADGHVTGKTPIAIQIHQTLFGGEAYSRSKLLEHHPGIRDWGSQELTEKALIMAGHEKFDYLKWIIPTIIEIEHEWLPMERFHDLQNWLIFTNKFMDLGFSNEADDALKKAYSKVSELARIQKFVKDGRHKVKDWQKSARFLR